MYFERYSYRRGLGREDPSHARVLTSKGIMLPSAYWKKVRSVAKPAESGRRDRRIYPQNLSLTVLSHQGCQRATIVGIRLPFEYGLDLAIQDRRRGN